MYSIFYWGCRDRNRLIRAFSGIDIVIHAAAMKQIVAAEYNPLSVLQQMYWAHKM